MLWRNSRAHVTRYLFKTPIPVFILPALVLSDREFWIFSLTKQTKAPILKRNNTYHNLKLGQMLFQTSQNGSGWEEGWLLSPLSCTGGPKHWSQCPSMASPALSRGKDDLPPPLAMLCLRQPRTPLALFAFDLKGWHHPILSLHYKKKINNSEWINICGFNFLYILVFLSIACIFHAPIQLQCKRSNLHKEGKDEAGHFFN